MSKLTIGKLANACGVKVDTVRYYERRGLLFPLERSDSGYRIYSTDSVQRLSFILKAQGLGFTLKEIKELIELSEKPESDCADVRELALIKVTQIEARITDLLKIKDGLKALTSFCPGDGKPLTECSILLHFQGGEP
jgi:Zn(II)-responsive transcriptional regulator